MMLLRPLVRESIAASICSVLDNPSFPMLYKGQFSLSSSLFTLTQSVMVFGGPVKLGSGPSATTTGR